MQYQILESTATAFSSLEQVTGHEYVSDEPSDCNSEQMTQRRGPLASLKCTRHLYQSTLSQCTHRSEQIYHILWPISMYQLLMMNYYLPSLSLLLSPVSTRGPLTSISAPGGSGLGFSVCTEFPEAIASCLASTRCKSSFSAKPCFRSASSLKGNKGWNWRLITPYLYNIECTSYSTKKTLKSVPKRHCQDVKPKLYDIK